MSSEEYFKSYRDKLKQLENYETDVKNLNLEVASIRNKIMSLQTECVKMRSIITVMIEEGIDHVEARLRDDTSVVSLWDDESLKNLTTTVTKSTYPFYNTITSISGNPYGVLPIGSPMSTKATP